MSPKVLRRQEHGVDGIIYTDDHAPAHVHVKLGEKEAIILLDSVSVRQKLRFNSCEIKRILLLIEQHRERLLEMWDKIYPKR